jgi:hypothetical protein
MSNILGWTAAVMTGLGFVRHDVHICAGAQGRPSHPTRRRGAALAVRVVYSMARLPQTGRALASLYELTPEVEKLIEHGARLRESAKKLREAGHPYVPEHLHIPGPLRNTSPPSPL